MIPFSIKVAGIKYEINKVENMENEFNCLGEVLYTNGIIKIDSALARDIKEQVFIQELLHACFYEAGIEEQDEHLINRWGIVLHQVLRESFSRIIGAPIKI